MAHHGWIPVLDPDTLTPSGFKSPFGRLFEASDHSYNSHAIALLTGGGGPLDESVNPAASTKPPNPAGFTFFGQFVDHDVTEFRVLSEDDRIIPANPQIGQRQRVLEDGRPNCTNGRVAKLDLDSVYGVLGIAQPDLHDDAGLFILERDAASKPIDIKRSPRFNNGRLIADPRNDENKLILQVHLLFELLHNKLHAAAAGSAADKRPGGAVFAATRGAVRNAYRRIVFHDYLPRIVQTRHIRAVLDAMVRKATFFDRMGQRAGHAYEQRFGVGPALDTPLSAPGGAVPGNELLDPPPKAARYLLAMPVEFAHAVFRLGHSQLRDRYDLSATMQGVKLFGGQDDLRGDAAMVQQVMRPVAPDGPPAPVTLDFRVDWNLFFGVSTPPGGTPVALQPGRPLDLRLPAAVFRLPPPAVGEPPISLAERNIRRGIDFGLPSGQEAAAYLTEIYGGIEGLRDEHLFPHKQFNEDYREILQREPRLSWATPLWYYILAEAGRFTDGPQLGDVGGLIVAETLLGCLTACDGDDGFDFTGEAKKWRATYPDDRLHPEVDTAPGKPGKVDDIDTMAKLLDFIGAW